MYVDQLSALLLRAYNDSLPKLYADITNLDLLVNNLVQRARSHGFAKNRLQTLCAYVPSTVG